LPYGQADKASSALILHACDFNLAVMMADCIENGNQPQACAQSNRPGGKKGSHIRSMFSVIANLHPYKISIAATTQPDTTMPPVAW
jgi:hypothetical protein